MKILWGLMVCLLLAACEAQATPIASMSTPTVPPQATLPPTQILRYGAAPNIVAYLGDDVAAPYEILDNNLPITAYDLVVAYGIYDGWQQSPVSHRVSLAINPNLPPLTIAIFRDLMTSIVNPQVIVDTLNIPNAQQTTVQDAVLSTLDSRTLLANNGYPDGFQLIMATETVPALDLIVSQFADLSVDLRLIDMQETVISDNQAHLVLFLWAQETERSFWVNQVGEENILDLWTMPISYLAQNDRSIEFTENGIPLFVE